MARESALVGAIALLFGLGSYYATGEAGAFAWLNLAVGAVGLLLGAVLGLRQAPGFGTPAARRVLLPRLGLLLAVVAGAALLDRVSERTGVRLDWTREQIHGLSEGTIRLLEALPATLDVTLYREAGDPRARRTWLTLQSMAQGHDVSLHERLLENAQDEAQQLGISSTEAVVMRLGDDFEVVERPTEGALYEALWRLEHPGRRTLYVTSGEGEGDLRSLAPTGYSGLASILETEGYTLQPLVTATGLGVPEDAGAVLVLGPRRGFTSDGIAKLQRYLESGGGMVVLLDPGVETGLGPLLERWGFSAPDRVVVDPPSGRVQGGAPGINPISRAYTTHAVTRGLDGRTLSLFLEARPVEAARKPEPDDDLSALVWTSPEAWLAEPTPAVLRGNLPERPPDQRPTRYALAAAGAYPRPEGETRIVVFGDSRFADNEYLRSLYNLDLMVNAVHWVVRREEAIALRPKVLTPNQDPFTPQQSLAMLYGVGLLLPELLLAAGAVVWIRRRGA